MSFFFFCNLDESAPNRVGQRVSNEVHHCIQSKENPFADVWRDWVKVSKRVIGSLNAQSHETISGLARHGQTDLENHDVQTKVEKFMPTTCGEKSPQ